MRRSNDRTTCEACQRAGERGRKACYEHSLENREAHQWIRHKNGYYGGGIPSCKQARWEMQADELLDQKSPAWWGEDFALAWAIATEFGRVTGWEPVVMRFSEREWQQLKKTSPEFCAAPARSVPSK
jgi:hypothetical protein